MSSQLRGIEFGLAALLTEVMGLRLALVAKGKMPKPGDPKTLSHFERLHTIGERVMVMLRTLKSMEHAQWLRADRLHALPREARYGERQSIDSHLADIQRVRALALKLAAELRACHGESMTPTAADLIEGTQKLLSELGKSIDRVQLQATVRQVSDGPAFVNPTPAGAPGASAADVLSQVWLLLACAVALTRNRKS
jgi:hypothetical protein